MEENKYYLLHIRTSTGHGHLYVVPVRVFTRLGIRHRGIKERATGWKGGISHCAATATALTIAALTGLTIAALTGLTGLTGLTIAALTGLTGLTALTAATLTFATGLVSQALNFAERIVQSAQVGG